MEDRAKRIVGKPTEDMDEFFEMLETIVKTKGIEDAMHVGNLNAKWTFVTLSPVTLSTDAPLSTGQRSDRNSVRVSLVAPIPNIEYRMHLKDEHMFSIKQSTVSGKAGFGLFAARPYAANTVIGMYGGEDITHYKHTARNKLDKIVLHPKTGKLYCPINSRGWMGMHYMNNSMENPNTALDFNLFIYTLTFIEEGDELFLNNNFDD